VRSSVKNNGQLLGGDPEDKQKATIKTCAADGASHTEKEKNYQPVKKKQKNNQLPGPEYKMDVACQRRNG